MQDEVRRAVDEYFWYSKDMYSNVTYPFHEHPWLDFASASADGREIRLRIKFWADGHFCCDSPACRFMDAFFDTDWPKLRRLLQARGVEPSGPIRFVVRVEYEAGAKFAQAPGHPNTDYDVVQESCWGEFETNEARPTRSQGSVRSSKARLTLRPS